MIRPSELVSVYRLVPGSDLHVRLMDLCSVLKGEQDVHLLQLIMGGASPDDMSEQMAEPLANVEGRIKRLRRDVHH